MVRKKEVRWVKHYSSSHRILLVGEGDFSFSLCLALAFGSASNICASSLDSYDDVIEKYKQAKSNLETLKKLGAYIVHGVDAKKMKLHPDLQERKFDRIIFNFPHAGFCGKEDNEDVISMHRTLVGEFFRNASSMLRANGEVHVSHKTTAPFCSWNLGELACRNFLTLSACVPFKIEDYPGYNNKRGDGFRCDEPFPLGECSTFKFRVASYEGCIKRPGQPLRQRPIKIPKLETSFERLGHPRTNLNTDIKEISGFVELPLTMNIQRENRGGFDGCFRMVRETFPRAGNVVDYYAYKYLGFNGSRHPQANFTRNVNVLPGYMGLPLRSDIHREGVGIFDGCYNTFRDTLGGAGRNVDYSLHGSLFPDSEKYMAERPSRTLNGYLYLVEEPHRQMGTLSSAELQRMVLLYGNPVQE